jgi:hypothetical protein
MNTAARVERTSFAGTLVIPLAAAVARLSRLCYPEWKDRKRPVTLWNKPFGTCWVNPVYLGGSVCRNLKSW